MKRYPVAGPSISELEKAYVADAVANGWYDEAGAWPARFETAFRDHTGRAGAAALPSATSGLHLVLAALGVGPGDEVIVPEATWIASSAPVSYVGATPVFADIDADTWCLSAESVAECLTDRTRAVIPVDLYGGMPDWEALHALVDPRGIAVIEDAAEAVGATWDGAPSGSFGLASVFSFHGSKTLTTGEGGMVLTDDLELLARINLLRDHGRAPGDVAFANREVAYKYKMSAMQAALGCAQLERVGDLVAKKRDLYTWYAERLAEVDGLALNPSSARLHNAYWMVTAVIDGIDKTTLCDQLAHDGVATRPFFNPLSGLLAYADSPDAPRAQKANSVVRDISPHGLNLPSALSLEESDVDEVCQLLRAAIGR